MKTKTVSLPLSDEEFVFIAKKAHEKDITFNEMFNEIIKTELDKLEKNPAAMKKFIGGFRKSTKKIAKKTATKKEK